MYFKLVIMKKIVFIFSLLSVFSCKTLKSDDKEYYIRVYKGNFFKSCLDKGYQDKFYHQIILSDKSYSSDFLIGINEYKKIDSLVMEIKNEIKADSINSLSKSEGARGKKVIEKCICFYESSKLDSIAEKAYKTHLKNQKNENF